MLLGKTIWSGLNVACCCCRGRKLCRKDSQIIQVNAVKIKNIKTVISVQPIQRPLFFGVLAQLFKSKLQEGWREKSASGNSELFCSGYIPLLPDHPFNTWLAFSELSALWTCRQAGLIWECTQFNAAAGEPPTWAEKRLGPLRTQLHYYTLQIPVFPFAAPHQHIALLFGFYTHRNNYSEIFVGSITMDSGLGPQTRFKLSTYV